MLRRHSREHNADGQFLRGVTCHLRASFSHRIVGDVSENRHVDSFSKTQPGSATHASPANAAEKRGTDNAAQTARAEAQREYTAGGGDTETAPSAPAAPSAPLAAAISRARSLDRPSPFGTGHFPPLPVPPGVD